MEDTQKNRWILIVETIREISGVGVLSPHPPSGYLIDSLERSTQIFYDQRSYSSGRGYYRCQGGIMWNEGILDLFPAVNMVIVFLMLDTSLFNDVPMQSRIRNIIVARSPWMHTASLEFSWIGVRLLFGRSHWHSPAI